MSEHPERDPVIESALRAGRSERPDEQARQRTLTALGLGAATGVTVGAAKGAASAATGAAKATGAALAQGAVAKWVGAGVVSMVMAGTVWHATSRTEPAPAAAVSAAPVVSGDSLRATPAVTTSAAPVEVPPAATPGGGAPAASAAVASVSAVVPSSGAPRAMGTGSVSGPTAAGAAGTSTASAASAAPAASAPAEATIQDEIAMLEVARGAVRRGNAGEAQGALDAYRARFPRGQMSPEVFPIQIEIMALTDRASARRLVADHLERNPRSPYGRRLRLAVGLPEPTP